MKDIIVTEEYKAIINAINNGVPCVFISGNAGSGKTTLLHYMTDYFEKAKKNLVIVAPTGTAALQANGVTINSFFRFAFGVVTARSVKKPSDPTIYKEMDILLLDEASMGRADVIDGIDLFLRRVRGINKPFGGVQVILIGDLFQLPPVAVADDQKILTELGYTEGNYFFNANVFKKIPIRNIELTSSFRQKDVAFKALLNKVRVAQDSKNVVDVLNSHCYNPDKKAHPLAITLATTNAIAEEKNIASLSRLGGTPVIYKGEKTDDFKFSGANLPSLEKLVLKVGAVVMFTANDADESKRWVNGMLGKVIKLNKYTAEVESENGEKFIVEPHVWKSFEYFVKNGKIGQKQTGTYTQLPLTLGWAITIHKSQGKTLKHLHVDLGTGAFSTGQTYVALSRATDLEGMTFQRPVRVSDIKCCEKVKAFFNPNFELV